MAQQANSDDVVAARPEPEREIVKIADPLFFWIMVLVLALVVRIILLDTSVFISGTQAYSLANEASSFFLLNAGSLILPLIVGAAIGAEIGSKASSARKALKAGLINGIYAAIVYIIAIVIIYEVIAYMIPQSMLTPSFLIAFLIIPQVAVLIALIEIFAVLSHIRKVGS